jgi:hypothetical protein
MAMYGLSVMSSDQVDSQATDKGSAPGFCRGDLRVRVGIAR